MKIQLNERDRKAGAGFSLVELLVVIAVIGIMAAIAVPMISNVNEKSKDAKDRRNAQSLASMSAGATASGQFFGEKSSAILMLATSGVPSPDESMLFRVPNLTAADITGASRYLDLVEGNLVYNQAL